MDFMEISLKNPSKEGWARLKEAKVDTIQEKVQNLSMVFQPIWQITDTEPEIKTYETLLRYKDGDFFPFEIFNELTSSQENCDILNQWFEEQLTGYLEAHPEKNFSLNIDLQQMQYPSTWKMLLKLSQYKEQMMLELTEFYQISNRLHKRLFDDTMAYIRELGMRVAFDDVGNGQHSISFVTQNIHLVDSVKISLLHLQHLDPMTIGLIIDTWVRIAKLSAVSLVVEGIENEATAKILMERGILFQQGFYFSEPVRLNNK